MLEIKELLGFGGFLAGTVVLAVVAALLTRDVFVRRRARRRLLAALIVCVTTSILNATYLILLVVTRVPDWRQFMRLDQSPVTATLALSPIVGMVSILAASWVLVTTYRASLLDGILKHALSAALVATFLVTLIPFAGPESPAFSSVAHSMLKQTVIVTEILAACLMYVLVSHGASTVIDRIRRRPDAAHLRNLFESPAIMSAESVARLLPAIASTIESGLGLCVADVIVDSGKARDVASAHQGGCLVDALADDQLYQRLAARRADAVVVVGEADSACGLIAVRRRGALRASDCVLLRAIGREATRVYRRLQVEEGRRTAAIAQEAAARLAAEVKLASLRAQINPHFLFNTLNAIAALIDTNPGEAEHLIEDLSDVLRRLISDGRDVVALEDELELVDAYVKIERARLGYPLSYEKRIQAWTAQCLVPTLSIQPLVENAVRHGAIPKLDACSITVSVEKRDHDLYISVTDDGVGHSGVIHRRTGLRNVAERLSALYGPAYTLRFESQPGAGATASFSVPC